MEIQYKEGDVLQASEYYRVHQVNCKGVMGRGLAKQVHEQYPNVFKGYKYLCDQEQNNPNILLGQAQCVHVSSPKGVIVNLFGEDSYGETGRHTNYEAFYIGLETLRDKVLNKDLPKEIAFPHKIGSALGGADWNIIEAMIISVFKDTNIKVTIYQYDPNS